MKRIISCMLLAFLGLILSTSSHAQAPVDYRDVGVIVNLNDSTSVHIANYFMKKRSIPAENLIRIKTFASEIIDSSTFESIRKQIEDTLKDVVHRKIALNKKLNYLVTTKGVPLKVNRTDTCNEQKSFHKTNFIRCASFDNELMLVLGKYKKSIGIGDVYYAVGKDTFLTQHPYFDTMVHFSRSAFDIFLVTRLTAFTESTVLRMIDSSGPNKLINKAKSQFILDNIPYSHFLDTVLLRGFDHSYHILKNRGWNVNFDSTSSAISNQSNVVGYLSWGYTDKASRAFNGKLGNTYTNSSIGTMYYSFTARTFNIGGGSYKATISNYLGEGLTSAEGSVWEPWSFALPIGPILFGMYTDTTVDRRYNMAESFYASSRSMSWMAAMVGDPKASIITQIPARPAPIMDTITKVGSGKPRIIKTSNNMPGNYNWFATDSNTLKALAMPFDSTNPKWVASGKNFPIPANLSQGVHTYTYVNENISSSAFRQVTFGFTSIDEEIAAGAIFSIYPNPSKGEFNLEYRGAKVQDMKISVTDMLGKEVYSKTLAGATTIRENINLGNVHAGVYFCNLIINRKKTSRKLIIE
jgi:uncharacterized protein (TIGR03790 family)